MNRHNNDQYQRTDTKLWKDADEQFHAVVIDSICGRLHFDEILRDEATWKYNIIDRRKAGYRSELVAFVVCMRVADRASGGKSFATYHPDRKEGNAEAFVELADWLEESYEIPKTHIIKVYNKYPTLPRKHSHPLLYKPLHNSSLEEDATEENSKLTTEYSIRLEESENPDGFYVGNSGLE